MIKIKAALMNDLVDKHGEKADISFLKEARDSTNSSIKSSYQEHDYRFPPIARVSKAYILNEKGTNILYGEIEYFEKKDINKQNKIKNKKLTVMEFERPTIIYDRSYEISGLKKDVEELQNLISNEPPLFEMKKSLDPTSTLIIAFVLFAGKNFSEGFLNQMGADAWNKLKEIITKNSKQHIEHHYIFTQIIKNDKFSAEISLNFVNPLNIDLEKLVKSNSKIIDSVINSYYENSVKVSKIVFNSFDGQSIHHEYSLFEDGTPFDIKDIERYEKVLEDVINQIK